MKTRHVICLLALAWLVPRVAIAGVEPQQAVLGFGVTVDNLDESVRFYTELLDFHEVSRHELAGPEAERLFGVFGMLARVATLQLGGESLELVDFIAPAGRPVPPTRSNDGWFQHIAIVVRDMDAAYARVRDHGVVQVSSAPQTLPETIPAAAGIRAFYFNDPSGHVLELIWFPEGKGDPRWQETTDHLFLGIDHSAIAVRDTAASAAFYTNVLGFKVAGESTNFGMEQEHLNGVFGARVHITGLRLPAGPGVELLEYRAPGPGRPIPSDTTSADQWHWHTIVSQPYASSRDGFEKIASGNVSLVSPSPQRLLVEHPGIYGGGFMIRDPDGHAVLVATREDK